MSEFTFSELAELGSARIEELIDRAAWHQNHGNELEKHLLVHEARELAEVLDSPTDDVLYMTYHRHMSDDFGCVFEIEHGDEELMFGGI